LNYLDFATKVLKYRSSISS